MSKSKQKASTSARSSGRSRNTFGAGNPEDIPTALNQTNAPSSTSWSTRSLSLSVTGIPPLSTLCMHAFARGFRKLSSNEANVGSLKEWILAVPDSLIPRLFAAMKEREVYPSNDFIAAYLLRGTTITLDGDNMPELSKHLVSAITRRSFTREHLQELHLRNLGKVPDATFATVIEKLPALRILDLAGCAGVAGKTAEAAASCSHLSTLNINHTTVPPLALKPVLLRCQGLEVLKVAGIASWTDANITKLWNALGVQDEGSSDTLKLPGLQALKLKLTPVSDHVVNTMLEICPDLRRLDVSFTGIRRPLALMNSTTLEKLSLTATSVSSVDLLKTLSNMTSLRTLSLGALGRRGGSSIAVANSSAMTMTDETLKKLTKILADCPHLRSVSLAGNTKLGTVTSSALTDFVSVVGRRCEVLNLSGIPSLRSANLEGLMADDIEELMSPLRHLLLNGTGIDDAAAPYISTCKSLRTLEVGGTKITSEGLTCIIEACPRLVRLDLTSCRGIPLAQRRNFFDTYHASQPASP